MSIPNKLLKLQIYKRNKQYCFFSYFTVWMFYQNVDTFLKDRFLIDKSLHLPWNVLFKKAPGAFENSNICE